MSINLLNQVLSNYVNSFCVKIHLSNLLSRPLPLLTILTQLVVNGKYELQGSLSPLPKV